MKYLQGFKLFNKGLFTTNETDDEIGTEIANKISNINFQVSLIGNLKYMANNLKLDENPGIYNLTSNFLELNLEYYKDNKLQFKKILNCNATIRKAIFSILQNKYLAENNI